MSILSRSKPDQSYTKLAGTRREVLNRLVNKRANSLGGEPDEGFERDLASLAFSYIKDKAPMLVDHIKGFQLLERSQDNKRAVGVFGARVGKQWFYMPSIFTGGEVKGHEVCYLKNQDLCIPLKENWINYILSQKASVLGEGDNNRSRNGILQPDYSSMIRPGHKISAWAKEAGVIEDMARLVSDSRTLGFLSNRLAKRAKFAAENVAGPSLDQVVSKSVKLARTLQKFANAYPLFRAGLDRWYGANFAARMLKEATAHEAAKGAVNLLTKKAGVQLIGRPKPIEAEDVRIVTKFASLLPPADEHKTRVLTQGYSVIDNRGEDKIATEYRVEPFELSYRNPDSLPDVHGVLLADGTDEKCIVLTGPQGRERTRTELAVVISLSNKGRRGVIEKSRVFCRYDVEEHLTKDEASAGWFGRLPAGSKTFEKGQHYIAVDKSGKCTMPFYVDSVHDGVAEVWFEHYSGKGLLGGALHSRPSSTDTKPIKYIRFGKGERTVRLQDTLQLPEDAKLVPVGKESENCCSVASGSQLGLGDMDAVMRLMMNKTSALKLADHGSEVSVNGYRMSKEAGLFYLIRGHHFREEEAKGLLKTASMAKYHNTGYVTRVKYAAGRPAVRMEEYESAFLPFPNLNHDTYEVPPTTTRRGRVVPGFTANEPTEDEYGASTQYHDYFDEMPEEELLETAQRASQDGTKELFDAAGLSSLFKATPAEDMLHQFLPEWTTALDKSCRALLMYYWFMPALADQYGDREIPELGDSLRRQVDVLGDTVLFVKEKTIEPYGNLEDSGPDIAPEKE